MLLIILSTTWLLLLHETFCFEVGNVDGMLEIDGGRATYAIPLPFPKYFPDLLGTVTLTYDSFAGNGEAGYGWNIGGLSEITRCPQTFAQDGKTKGINYDKEDKFCLDGQRLVVVEGKYGTDNGVYYTEVDSYRKVTSHGKKGCGPSYFTVRTKDNKILTYGKKTESRLIGEGQTCVHIWFLDTVQDYVGNEVMVDYLATDRRRYVSKISSKNMAVEFQYKSRGDNTTTFFKGGILQENDKLLQTVTSRFKGKELSSLKLTHEESGDAKINVLTAFQFCGRDSNCLSPVIMEYDGMVDVHGVDKPSYWIHDFTQSSGWTSSTIRQLADLNGDGMADIVGFKDDGVYVSLNQNGSFGTVRRWSYQFGSKAASGNWSTQNHIRLIVDVNGDGLPDILGFGNDGVYVSFNTGHEEFGYARKMIGAFGYNSGWRIKNHPRFVQDVDGDGLVDIVGLAHGGVYVSFGRGTHFLQETLVLNEFGYATPLPWRVESHPRFLMDVTGDDLPDLVGFHDGGVYVAVNTGKGFAHKTQWISDFGIHRKWTVPKHERHLVDINGDGLADIMGFSSTGVVVALNDGAKFIEAKNWVVAYGTEAGTWKDGTHPRYIEDMNGDGLADIVGFGCCGVDVSLNTGSKFSNPQKWSSNYDTPTWKDKYGPRLLRDVNGDGVADIVGFDHNGVYVSNNKNRRTNIVKITDSFDNVDEIIYQSLGNGSIYTRDPNSMHPKPDINYGQLVVWKVLSSDGVGGRNITSYRYWGLKTDVSGRGSLGFQKIVEREEGEDDNIEHRYHQDFPLTGLESVTVHKVNGKIVSKYENTYKTSNFPVGTQQLHRVGEIANFYELDGKLVKTITRDFSKGDDFGNFGKVDIEVKGGGKIFKEEIVNQFATGDISAWNIEKLLSVQSSKSDDNGRSVTTTEFMYDQNTRLLIKEMKEPSNNLGLVVDRTYDTHGNVIRITQKPIHPKHLSNTSSRGRTVYKTYDSDGVLLLSTSNSLLHKESYQYDDYGNMIKITGANGLVTTRVFDAMDRPLEEYRFDGTKCSWTYGWDHSLPYAKYQVKKVETGKPTEISIFDSLERTLKIYTDGLKKTITEDIVYDRYGHVVRQSIPYFFDDKEIGWITYKYDIFGREIETIKPITKDIYSISKISYSGLITRKTDGLGHTTVIEHDVLTRVKN